MTGWIDSHCHLPADDAEARGVVDAAHAAGVATLITVGCDRASSVRNLCHAAALPGVYATVGLHPHEARHGVDTIADLFDAPDLPAPIAVGECGFDFHYDHSPRAAQREAFAAQVAIANERDLPLVIHTRDAWSETFELLDREGVPSHTVFHCFTGGPGEAAACVERGAYVSFSGIVTFKGAPDVAAAAAAVPMASILVETDSPYLAPVPHRGRPNQPAWVVDVGRHIAARRGLSEHEVRETTAANTARAFPALAVAT
ncbi:MAG: TatD family hydrolase [Desertimonas sp.]